jgi:hypothetical protein
LMLMRCCTPHFLFALWIFEILSRSFAVFGSKHLQIFVIKMTFWKKTFLKNGFSRWKIRNFWEKLPKPEIQGALNIPKSLKWCNTPRDTLKLLFNAFPFQPFLHMLTGEDHEHLERPKSAF